MTRNQIVTFCFIALLLFVVHQIVKIFIPFTHPIFWAAILAFGFYPFHAQIKKRISKHETIAALITTAIIILIVVPPLVVIVANVATQAVEFYQFATDYIKEGHLEKSIDYLKETAVVENLRANSYIEWEQIKENATNMLLNASKTITNFSVSQAGIITKNVFLIIINLVLVACLTFIFLKDGLKIYDFIYNTVPLEEDSKAQIFDQINGTFSAVIRGQILTSLTQAGITGAIFWGLGLPVPIFFAVLTFITALIPVVGAAGVWLPFTIFLVVQKLYIKAIILGCCGVFIISLIDNVMKPAVIGEKTKLPYFLLFFGILGGLQIYGIMGVFLAPAMLSLFFALVKLYQQKFS